MFNKYEKTYRIEIPQFTLHGKRVLSKDDARHLLTGNATIEEKLDGANTGIIRHKKGFSLQKRGSLVGQSEHEQFQYFHGWANRLKYTEIMSIPIGYLVYGELTYCVHTVYYDKLPDYFLVFDIITPKGEWLNRANRTEFCEEHGLYQVPLIAEGSFAITDLYKMIPAISSFGSEPAEGIVIKKYTKKGYWRGKLVRPEFVKKLDEEDNHWTHKQIRRNKLVA